jgi:hypothetical protein
MLTLDYPPMPEDARAIIAAGVDEVRFPFATEHMVARYAARLIEARDMLIEAGVRFGVSNLTVDF